MKKPIKISIQHLTPQHLLSLCAGALANCRNKFIKNLFISWFVKHYQVDMTEAILPKPQDYACFNDFFTRALKPESRPSQAETTEIISPVDGTISQAGKISGNNLIQAKGFDFTLEELLTNSEIAAPFKNGSFITLYLSPRDYHRVHMPYAGTLQSMLYVPGKLFAVNPITAQHVTKLFARNERVISIFKTDYGPMAVIMVGALIVASIETVWAGTVAPQNTKAIQTIDYTNQNNIALARAEEMGRFKLGSTVILLFPKNAIHFHTKNVTLNQAIKMGQKIGYFNEH